MPPSSSSPPSSSAPGIPRLTTRFPRARRAPERRILDLRDQLPHFTDYLSEAESAKDVKLTREMTMVQTLEITVHLLDELLKDQRFLPGAGVSLRGASAGSSRQVHQFTAPKTSTRLSDESRRIGDGSKSVSRSKSRSGSQGGREG